MTTPTKNFEIADVKATYYQEGDTNSDTPSGDNIITFEMEGIGFDMGYFVIKTERWAFDDIDEFVSLLQDFKDRCLMAKNNQRKS
jgi:hypothetical protein